MTEGNPPPSRAKRLLEQLAQLEELHLEDKPLSRFAAKLSAPVADEIALGDARIRRRIANTLMFVFCIVNAVTLVFLYLLFRADQGDLAMKLIPPDGRVITPNVVMTLLGATTAQLGTVMVIMARYVFPPRNIDPAKI